MKYAYLSRAATVESNWTDQRSIRIAELDKAEMRLTTLRDDLGIDPTQANQWESFAAAVRANIRQLFTSPQHRVGSGRVRPRSVVGILDTAIDELQQRRARLAAIRHATSSLYAVLSPRQRLKADRMLPGCCLPRGQVKSLGDIIFVQEE